MLGAGAGRRLVVALALVSFVGCGGGGPLGDGGSPDYREAGPASDHPATDASAEPVSADAKVDTGAAADLAPEATPDAVPDAATATDVVLDATPDAATATDVVPDVLREAPAGTDLATDPAADAGGDASGDVSVDAGPADTGSSGDAGASDAVTPAIVFVEPQGSMVYVTGDLAVEISPSPEAPPQIQLLVDDAVVRNLAPPFKVAFPTTTVSEGSHRLGCRATIAGVPVSCPQITIVVDRTAPALVGVSPARYAHPAPDAPIFATFSEALAPASFAAATVEARVDGVLVPSTATLNADQRTITVMLSGHPSTAQGAVLVNGALTDRAGNAMTAPATWSWRWSNVIDVGAELSSLAGEQQGLRPSIAVGPDDAPVVAWVSRAASGSTQGNRVVTQRWDGARWSTIGVFPDAPMPGHAQSAPAVAIAASGYPLVAWEEEDSTVGRFVAHVRAWSGSAWEVWDAGLPGGYRVQPVSDAAGNITVGMTEWPAQRPAVFRRDGSTWRALGDLMLTGAALADTPVIAGDAAGNLEMIWAEGQQVHTPQRRRWNGTAWQPATPPPSSGLGAIGPSVAMNAAGATAFAWTVLDVQASSQKTAIFAPGWAAALTFDGFTTGTVNDLDVDPSARVAVTVGRLSPPLLYVERWNGTVWDAPFDGIQFSASPESAAYGNLAYAASGKPFLAAYDLAGGRTKVYVVTLQTW